MSSGPENAKKIFVEATERYAPDQWPDYLDRACGDDAKLRRRVEILLEAHVGDESLLDSPAIAPAATVDAPPITEKPGTTIGPYRLLEQVGEGGMGVVFMAEQTEPVQRRVALKIIKPGMDTRQVIGRFEAERQALAMMDHPNIAKVHDAGTTESGRPFFVMELVGGTPITQYADEHQLTPQERLELFIPVCQAVQHAHQKGIIHRDIKPSNVMVAEYDDRPVPKVIDFGVAKAIEKRLTEKTMFTHYGQIVGTIDYMSPEQADLNQFDVDTRSDVYSLGVLLYELLTGETPFDRVRLHAAAFDELLRIIREEDPPKPSLRLSTSDSLPSTAANRKVEPKALSTLVRGELDWIVMKALEKDRTRRYDTANGFARDVQRYLDDEPVEACPPSRGYRFRKFVRRNKVALATVSIVTLALVLGLVGTTWQAFRAMKAEGEANQQRELAEQRLTEVDKQRQRAEDNFQKAMEAVDEMLTEVGDKQLADIPQMEPVRRSLLEKALTFYEEFLQEDSTDPQVRQETGRAHLRVGRISNLLGDHKRAEQAFRNAIKVFQKLQADFPNEPENRRDLAEGHNQLGQLQIATGLLKEADESIRQALCVCKELAAQFPENPEYRSALAVVCDSLGWCLRSTGRYPEAEDSYRQALRIFPELLRDLPGDPKYREGLARTYHGLAGLLWEAGRHEESEKSYHDALSVWQQLVRDLPQVSRYRESMGASHRELGRALNATGRNEDAEKAYRDALSVDQQLVRDFPNVLTYRCQLAMSQASLESVLSDTGRNEEAENAAREALSLWQPLVRDFPNVPTYRRALASGHNNLNNCLVRTGRYEEAEKGYREALSLWQSLVRDFPEVPEHRLSLGRVYTNLATVLSRTGRKEEAVTTYREALSIAQQLAPGPLGHRVLRAQIRFNLIGSLREIGRNEEAEQSARQALSLWQSLVRDFPEIPEYGRMQASSHGMLGEVLTDRGRYEEAEKNLRADIGICQPLVRKFPEVPAYRRTLFRTYINLGCVLEKTGRNEEAEKIYREALSIIQQLPGDLPEDRAALAAIHLELADVLDKMGRNEEAEKAAREALRICQSLDHDSPELRRCRGPLACSCNLLAWRLCACPNPQLRDADQAVELATEAVKLASQNGGYWNTLGVAQYRARDWKAATEALQKSLELRGDNACDWFFLSMARWQLGEKEQARKWYDKAVQWMDKNKPKDEELRRFRKEAEELLGIGDESKPKKGEPKTEKPKEQVAAPAPA